MANQHDFFTFSLLLLLFLCATITTHAQAISNVEYSLITIAGGSKGEGVPALQSSMNNPYGVALSSNGTIFYTDTLNNLIKKIDENGNVQIVAGGGSETIPSSNYINARLVSLNNIYGITFNSKDEMYLVDNVGNLLTLKYLKGYYVIKQVASFLGQYSFSGGMAIDGDDTLFLAELTGLIVKCKLVPEGYIITHFTTNSLNITGLAISPSTGNIFYNDYNSGLIYYTTTKLVHQQLPVVFSTPYSLVFSANGKLFVSEFDTNRIFVMDENGAKTVLSNSASTSGFADGEPLTAAYKNPRHLAFKESSLYIADSGNNRIRKLNLVLNTVSTIAGDGSTTYSEVNGALATASVLSNPQYTFYNSKTDELLIADTGSNKIKKITSVSNTLTATISTIFGNGTYANSIEGALGTQTSLNSPLSVIQSELTGDIYVGANSFVYLLDNSQRVKYFAGRRTKSDGENLPAIAAILEGPVISAFSPHDQCVYFMHNFKLRKVLTNGTLITIAGSGLTGDVDGPALSAQFRSVTSISFENNGDVLLCDSSSHKIKKYSQSTKYITTIAGSGLGNSEGLDALSSLMNQPLFAVYNNFTNETLIADYQNFKIKKIGQDGKIVTIAGSGAITNYYDNVAAKSCHIQPSSIAIHPVTGDIYFTDVFFKVVRKLDISTNNITTVIGNGLGNLTSIQTGDNSKGRGLGPSYGLVFAPNGDLYVSFATINQIIRLANNATTLEVVVGTSGAVYNGEYRNGALVNTVNPWRLSYGNGEIYFGDYFGRIRKFNISTSMVLPFAGGFGDYGTASNAIINTPNSMAIAYDSNELFISDATQNRIRKVSLSNNIITTAVGTSDIILNTDSEVPAYLVGISSPSGLLYYNQKLIFCDTNNYVLQSFNVSNNKVTRVAGNGYYSLDLNDNIVATTSTIRQAQSVGRLPDGSLVVAETGGHIIRKINSQGSIQRIAGSSLLKGGFSYDSNNASSSLLNSPKGISVLPDGRIIFADSGNNLIRMLVPYCQSGYVLESVFGKQVCSVACWGISSLNSSSVCSGKGSCVGVDRCVCSFGYSGSDCSNREYTGTLLGAPSYVVLEKNSKILNKDFVISKFRLSTQDNVDEFLKDCIVKGVACDYQLDYSISSPNSSVLSFNASNIQVSPINSESRIISLLIPISIRQFNLNTIPTSNFKVSFSITLKNGLGKIISTTFTIPFVLPISPPSNLFDVVVGSGSALSDNFTIRITEWTNGIISDMLPLKYAIGIYPSQTTYAIRLTEFSESRNVSFVLPYLKSDYNIQVIKIFVMDNNGNINSDYSTKGFQVLPFSKSQQELLDLAISAQLSYNLLTALTYDRSFENITNPEYYSSLIKKIAIDIKDVSTSMTVINFLFTKSSTEQLVVDETLSKLSEVVGLLSDNYNKSKSNVGYVSSKVDSNDVKTIMDMSSSIWSTGYSIQNTRDLTSNLANLLLIGESPSLLGNSSGLSLTSYTSSNINLTVSSFVANSGNPVNDLSTVQQGSIQVQFNPGNIITKYSAVSVDCGISVLTYSINNYGEDHVENNSSQVLSRNSTSSITDFKFLKNQKVLQLENLETPILLTFKLLDTIDKELTRQLLLNGGENSTIYNFTCAYLDESSGLWNNQGCSLKSYNINSGTVECACNHTTLFTTFLEQKTLALSEKTQLQVASLYYGQISLGIFYFIISSLVLILLFVFRKEQPVHSRAITPYLGMIALITESVLIYIVQRSVLVDQLHKNSTNWSSGDLASNWIANIVMIFVNTLNLTAILAFLIQVCRNQLLKYLYNILFQIRKSEFKESREKILKHLRLLTNTKLVNGVLIGFAISNALYWTLWVILRRTGVIPADVYTYIVSISYIVVIFSLSACITGVAVCDFVISTIRYRSSNSNSIEKSESTSEETNKTKVQLEKAKQMISSMGIHKWIVSMDSPLYFRFEMLLYIIFFILLIVNQSLGMSTLPFRYENEESFRKVLTNDVIAFIFEVLYVAVYVLVFGGYALLILLSNKIKFKLRKIPPNFESNENDYESREMLQVIGNSYGKSLFEEFCKKEFSTENLYLFLDLQENEKLIQSSNDKENIKEISEFIKRIYCNHIQFGSAMEVNIPSSLSKEFGKIYSSLVLNQDEARDTEMVDLKNNNSSFVMKEKVEECFKNLKDNVIINLSDTFSRFVLCNEYQIFSQAFDFASELGKSLKV